MKKKNQYVQHKFKHQQQKEDYLLNFYKLQKMEYVIKANMPDLLSQAANNNTTNNQSSGRNSSPLGAKISEIHQIMMIVVWLLAITVGLWSMAFKQYRFAVYLHFFIMGIVTIIAWMSGFLAIITFGVHSRVGPLHTWLGVTVLIITTLQAIGGMVCWWMQKQSEVWPFTVKILNYLHTIFGWVVFILVLVEMLDATRGKNKYFIPIIVISLVSTVFYLILKLFRKKMRAVTGYRKLNSQYSLYRVKTSQDLSFMNDDYFIFADKIYDLHKVLGNHPGGYDIIKKIKGREVDRFIYGAETLQGQRRIAPYVHSASSMALAGDPIGILESINPYQNLHGPIQVFVQQQYYPSANPIIYAPYLSSTALSRPLIYNGYSDISQLGKHFAVTIGGLKKITRLYSVVNFMNPHNIDFMSRIRGLINNSEQIIDSYRSTQQIIPINNIPQLKNILVIPLLIKKYIKGQFTSNFLNGIYRNKVFITPSQGRGLALHQLPASEIVFLAGGTGVYPFCDMIDLMFKQALLSSGSGYRDEILKQHPILKASSLIKNYKVLLYYSVHNADQIIDNMAYQVNFLCSRGIMEAYFKMSQNNYLITSKYPSIRIFNSKFQDLIPNLVQKLNKISKIYLCGPPVMTNSITQTIIRHQIPSFKYRIL